MEEEADELVGEVGGEPRFKASGTRRALVDALDRRSGLASAEESKVDVVVSVLERCGRVFVLLTPFDEGPAPGVEGNDSLVFLASRSELLFLRLASDEC